MTLTADQIHNLSNIRASAQLIESETQKVADISHNRLRAEQLTQHPNKELIEPEVNRALALKTPPEKILEAIHAGTTQASS